MRATFAFWCLLLAYGFSPVLAQYDDIDPLPNSSNDSTDKHFSTLLFAGGGIGNDPWTTSIVTGCVIYNHFFSTTLRYVYQDPFPSHIFLQESISELGILFGPTIRGDHFMFSASAGVGMLAYKKGENYYIGDYSNYTEKTYRDVGIPIGLQLSWLPFKHFGTGLYSYVDFNELEEICGLTLILIVRF